MVYKCEIINIIELTELEKLFHLKILDEAERQRQVWTALRGSLSDEERVAIEFVFTIAPEEKEHAEEAV